MKNYINQVLEYFNIPKLVKFYEKELIQITLLGIILLLLYILLSLFLNYSLKITLSIDKKKEFRLEKIKTIFKGFKTIIKFSLVLFYVFFIINKFNLNLTVILTGAGFLGATIFLIFQNILRDIFTGWVLFFEDLFRVGERVMINNTFAGMVIDLKFRFLVLRGDKGEIINLPYSQINTVHNFSRKRIVEKLVIKFKREILDSKFFDSFEDTLKKFFYNYQNTEFKIDKNYNIYENYFEVFVVIKTPTDIKEEIDFGLKQLFLEKFNNSLIEIKNES